jgi:hypothetical protein
VRQHDRLILLVTIQRQVACHAVAVGRLAYPEEHSGNLIPFSIEEDDRRNAFPFLLLASHDLLSINRGSNRPSGVCNYQCGLAIRFPDLEAFHCQNRGDRCRSHHDPRDRNQPEHRESHDCRTLQNQLFPQCGKAAIDVIGFRILHVPLQGRRVYLDSIGCRGFYVVDDDVFDRNLGAFFQH